MSPRTTIDQLGTDLLQNILVRLSSVDFASADCVSRSWNKVCGGVLSRPKLSSAFSFNSSLQVAVEEVVNKVLLEPIRPHFAIASVSPFYSEHGFQEAHQLIAMKLGSKVPVITTQCFGIIGRDAISDEFQETLWTEEDVSIGDSYDPSHVNECPKKGIMLTVGFAPGLKVKLIPLRDQIEGPQAFMIDKFITDIKKFSTSTSGCDTPAAMMIFSVSMLLLLYVLSTFHGFLTGFILHNTLEEPQEQVIIDVMGKVDYDMSLETVIVGGYGYQIRHSSGSSSNITASEAHCVVALVFVMDKKKPPGIGETQFHAELSSGLLPVGPAYKVASIERNLDAFELTVRREGLDANLNGETILRQAYKDLGDMIDSRPLYIGVTKRRKCSIGQGKLRWTTCLEFHEVLKCGNREGFLFVDYMNIKAGDNLRFYHPDPDTALSSVANVSNHLRSFKQVRTNGSIKQEVFGGFIFTYYGRVGSFFEQPNVASSPFLDNYPSVTLGGTLCGWVFGRGDLTEYAEESQEQKSVRCFMHEYGAVYLIMSYSP